MTTEAQPENKAWHLDRKVPIAIISALVLQTLAGGFWAGGLSTKVDAFERRVVALEDMRSELLQRLTAVETNVVNQTDLLRGQQTTLTQILTELRQK